MTTPTATPRTFGLYLHVPFCRTRCGYCDFNTYTPSELSGLSPDDYIEAALREIELARAVMPADTQPISTIFIGGGTPTMLTPAQLGRLLSAATDAFGVLPDAEITTEANPETLDERVLAGLLDAGITRVSMGMQSAVEHVLATLDRTHTPGHAVEMAKLARRVGFAHVSLDLIYGTPGESADDWQASLDAVASADPDHVSAYSLIVEPGTRLARRVRAGELPEPDEDDLALKYLATDKHLVELGFSNYEVSNWALNDAARCQHNLAYWRGGDWWGIGPGAHSHVDGVRWWNRKHPRTYANALAAGQSPEEGREVLTAEQRRMERVLLELRISDGLPLAVLTDTEQARLADPVERGLATIADGRVHLTLTGRLLADAVVRDVLD